MSDFPFAAIVGQDDLKTALLLNAIFPGVGGVLISGERGTAKSTAARALADLLPPIRVRRGCPCHTSPEDPPLSSEISTAGDSSGEEWIPVPFVELPLGATEDRVVGSLDFQQALREGRRVFQPGLLAAANRGILYVDEVNLLPDHLVDLLLDSTSSGRNVVQRDGLSFTHPARCQLVGTMNPEEGRLRPQLLDRFGLMVTVAGFEDSASRAEAARRRIAFDADPVAFLQTWEAAQQQLRQQIVQAISRLPSVGCPGEIEQLIAEFCLAANTDGLRADITLHKAARALAGLRGQSVVTERDVHDVARLVLPHRSRRDPHAGQSSNRQTAQQPRSEAGSPAPEPSGDGTQQSSDEPRGTDTADYGTQDQSGGVSDEQSCGPDCDKTELPLQTFAPVPSNVTPRFEVADTRASHHHSRPANGHRNPVEGTTFGRTVRAVRDPSATSIALAPTLRSAVAHGESRRGRPVIQSSDLHRHERAGRQGTLILFIVDASGSIGARKRMSAVKGTVLNLLDDAYMQRDRVAVIAFRGTEAQLLLPPGSQIDLARAALQSLPTGGRTPLAHALVCATDLLRREQETNPQQPLLALLLTDGRANVSLPNTTDDAWTQTLSAAGGLAALTVALSVVDTEEGLIRQGRAAELAEALGAPCLSLEALSAEALTIEVQRSLEGPFTRTGRRP